MASDVFIQKLDGEAVILSLVTDKYYGLDAMGLSIWNLLTSCDSIGEAFDRLLETYEVEPEDLRRELDGLVEKLLEQQLIVVEGS